MAHDRLIARQASGIFAKIIVAVVAATTDGPTLYIVACGKYPGNNGMNPIRVFAIVTADSVRLNILN